MSILTQAEMEARYDAERSGQLYAKPAITCPACSCENGPAHRFCDQCGAPLATDYTPLSPAWEAVLAITDDPTNDGRNHDAPLSADEERALDILLATTPIIPSRDQAHRQQRWEAILDQIADMDEAEQAEALRFTETLLERIHAAHA